ncbi:cupin domain-containing protein [Halapricum hydrolyticum]|uniref:Cupin domain-containing protein n=1 Tax=Halapricum hydrolyticum TaxID=2979991 RepID=A0AAE3IDV9_9EURY|nr:cupin domain-containing protein [Halapricum hydrolyticum]MCU4719230.1 cupin domain-containing protein [Halapricum hydrolyticum]MCU4728337.1 cupin domain-containing protein [Halapricum hydrolyticum]
MKRPDPSEWIERDSYRKQILATEETIGFDGNLLQVVEVPPGEHVEPHYHRETEEVFYVLQAGGTLVIDDVQFSPTDGEVIICEPGDVHEVFNESDQPFRILVFKVNLTDDDTVWLD